MALVGPGCQSELPPPTPGQEGDLRVVLILIDTLRADRMPPSAYELPVAPFLETLAAKSIVFRHAHSTSSWTAPAVASLFTSLQPIQHGVRTGLFISRQLGIEVNRLPRDLPVLPEILQDAGYATLAVSENPNVSHNLGFERGFHRFRELEYEGAEHIAAAALDWRPELEEHRRSFLYLHFMDPHDPYHARSPWFEEFVAHEDDARARYDSEIRHVDSQIATLFERFGWDEDTLLIVLSDHGEEFGDHGSTSHGHSLYSELIDIPLMFYCPRLWPTGRVIEDQVSIVDVLPTLTDLLGLPRPENCQGKSLVETIEGESPRRGALYAHLQRRDLGDSPDGLVMRSLILGNRKLIVSNAKERQLFDLRLDPTEQQDLAGAWGELADALVHVMLGVESSVVSHDDLPQPIEASEALRAQLRSLGYADSDERAP